MRGPMTTDVAADATTRNDGLMKALGPGLVFAAAAVGVSHLVQSTRAGAQYGLALLGFVAIANATKYPAFRFGPEYAAATGTSLLEGYRKQGRWALALYALVTVATMFTVQAAVTVVTAGLALATFGLTISPLAISAVLMVLCLGLLALGNYRWLDLATKVLVVVFTIATLTATLMVLGRIAWTGPWWPTLTTTASDGASHLDVAGLMFIAAFVGWMPAPIDIAVWQSLWTLAREKDTAHPPTLREARVDFHVGYLGSVVLAVCFVLMGAGVMYGSGREFSSSASQFAADVIGLYTETLGPASGIIIGIAAFAVMFSTTLTVIDGFPRALSTLYARMRSAEEPHTSVDAASTRSYWVSALVLLLGALAVLALFMTSLKAFVDLATTLSFLTAPALAGLNHRVITAPEVPAEARPTGRLRAFSLACIVFHTLFALGYLYVRFG